MMEQIVQTAIQAVLDELERQATLPEYNYDGGSIHPENASMILRDFTDIRLTQEQTVAFWYAWDDLMANKFSGYKRTIPIEGETNGANR